MRLALDAAGGVPEPTAWAHVELAKLALGDGRVDAAARARRAALTVFPGYVLALEQQARVDAARGPSRGGGRHRAARRRPPCRSRSSSRCSATCSIGRAGRRRRRAQRARRRRPSTGCWQRTGCGSTSSRAVFRADHRIRPAETRPPRPSRAGRPAVDLRRRRARLGARARGRCAEAERVARPRAAARHEGRAPLLPSRVCSGLRRRPACDARVVPPGARPEPAPFRCAGRRSPERRSREAPRGASQRLSSSSRSSSPSRREASAHPLGNFTVNHYAGIELAGDRVFVRYVLDLAEIPTFQSGDRVARASAIRRSSRASSISASAASAPVLRPWRTACRSVPEPGGLPTLRLRGRLRRRRSAVPRSPFADRSFASRIGWREITVSARDGARLVHVIRAGDEPVRRAACLPAGRSFSSPLDVGRRRRVSYLATRARGPSASTGRAAPGASRWGIRSTRRARQAVARHRRALAARSRRSGVRRTPSRPGTARRSSPATWSAPAAGHATPSLLGRDGDRRPTRRAFSDWGS